MEFSANYVIIGLARGGVRRQIIRSIDGFWSCAGAFGGCRPRFLSLSPKKMRKSLVRGDELSPGGSLLARPAVIVLKGRKPA